MKTNYTISLTEKRAIAELLELHLPDKYPSGGIRLTKSQKKKAEWIQTALRTRNMVDIVVRSDMWKYDFNTLTRLGHLALYHDEIPTAWNLYADAHSVAWNDRWRNKGKPGNYGLYLERMGIWEHNREIYRRELKKVERKIKAEREKTKALHKKKDHYGELRKLWHISWMYAKINDLRYIGWLEKAYKVAEKYGFEKERKELHSRLKKFKDLFDKIRADMG